MSDKIAADTHQLRSTAGNHRGLSGFVKIWFAIDAVVAMFPPLYWAANGKTDPILGIPTALFYFLAVSLCIAASIVVAYLQDRGSLEVQP